MFHMTQCNNKKKNLMGDMAAGMRFLKKITQNVFLPYSNSFVCYYQ